MTTVSRLATVVVVFLGATLSAQAPARDRVRPESPVAGTGVIRGRVTAASTGDPLRHAVVTVAGGATSLAATLTDEEGRFQFSVLPQGALRVTAAKPGFARTSTTVELAAGTTAVAPDIALLKGGVVTGIMVDDTGEVLADERIFIARVEPDGAARPRIVVGSVTDGSGAFRFGGLAAGTYVVESSRMPDGGSFLASAGDIYPTARQRGRPDSPRIALQAGEERSGAVAIGPAAGLLPPRPKVEVQDPRLAIVLRGRVSRAGGRPVPLAVVQILALTPGPPAGTQTDENGRYEIVVPAGVEGDYRIAVRRPGFVQAEYGALSPQRRGALLHLRPGETHEDLDVALTKMSSLNGRILDDFGDPVEGALVHAAQLRYVDGQRKLVDAASTSRTDDLGRYRVGGLRVGQYAIVASVGQVVVAEPAAEFPGFGTAYFPGTANPSEIQLLSVGAAQDLNDLDFRLVRQKSFRIAGHASDSSGDPVSGGISLSPRRKSGAIATIQMGARIDRGGGFEFLNVPPGEYVLQVSRGNRSSFSEGEFAYRFIDVVDGDVTGLEIQTGLGSSIAGRLTFEGGEPPALDRLELSAAPADLDRSPGGQTARARLSEDLRFELERIHGPRRIQANQLPAGWTMKAVIVDGLDVTDEPLPFGRDDESVDDVEVVFAKRATKIVGRIAEARDVVPGDLAVLAFSSRRDQWYPNSRYIRRAAPRADGTFTFEALPPGEYFLLAAYPPEDAGEWRDPDSLEKLALHATRVRLAEGQAASVELRIR